MAAITRGRRQDLSAPALTLTLLACATLALGALAAVPARAAAGALCGNGVVEAGEDCDDGGTCIGGDNAGTHCTAESDCTGNGVCAGGARRGTDCAADADCPGSVCTHCVPQGGDGCAANCTAETDVAFNINSSGPIPLGILQPPAVAGVTVYGNTLTVPVPLSGSQTLTIGKPVGGQIPVVIKAASVQFPAVDVSGVACACVRGVAAKTCGGTVFDSDGTPSADCTLDDGVCAGKHPCTAVHGAGNAAAGVIGCDGLDAVNVTYTQDAAGGPTALPAITFDGSGGPGSAVLFNTIAIGVAIGSCTGTAPAYGPDGQFCTADDPPSAQGAPLTLPFTTAGASAQILNADGQAGTTLGPFSAQGAPFSCSALAQGTAAGSALAGAFTQLGEPAIGDAVVTADFAAGFAAATPPPLCCNPDVMDPNVCLAVTCTPPPQGTPTPAPTPEGACYLGSADCTGQSYKLTSQATCCTLAQQTFNGPIVVPPSTMLLPVAWCPLDAFDPATGQCNACGDPCAGLPTPTPVPTFPNCCDPNGGVPCPFDIACPLPPVAVDVGTAAGAPGATATFDVTLQSFGVAVAGVQNDIAFDPSTPIVHCAVNPAINKNLTGFNISGTRLRAVVIGTNTDAIPDGAVLYTCTVNIAASAAPGVYPLVNGNLVVADAQGNQIPAAGKNGEVDVLGTPTPTPTPEGECFVGPPDCAGKGFPTAQQACCDLSRFGAFPGTASWCPAAAVDPSTGQCSACGDPCAGLPTPPPCCDPTLGVPCVFDSVLCPRPTPIPPPFGGCALACDERPCLGTCPNGQIEEGTCSALSVDRGCMCVPDCGPVETPSPAPAECGAMCDPTQSCTLPFGPAGVSLPVKGVCAGQTDNGCTCVPAIAGTPVPSPSSGIGVSVGAIAGQPGTSLTVSVILHSGGSTIAAVQNDLGFDPNAPITGCTVNPALGKNLSAFSIGAGNVRAVIVGANLDPIPDGAVLYTCSVSIGATAALGTYPLTVSNVVAADPSGNAISAGGTDGKVTVLSAENPTPGVAPTATLGAPAGAPNDTGGPAVHGAAWCGGGGGGCDLDAAPDRSPAFLALTLVPALLWVKRRRMLRMRRART